MKTFTVKATAFATLFTRVEVEAEDWQEAKKKAELALENNDDFIDWAFAEEDHMRPIPGTSEIFEIEDTDTDNTHLFGQLSALDLIDAIKNAHEGDDKPMLA